MATNENLIPIPGRLHSVATEGHVAGADEIYDDTLGELQSEVNASKADLVNGKVPFAQIPTLVDEEDLTVVNNNIKFKDRPNTDGMGRVILRKNIVSGVNTLTQSMINQTNTIYVIQYDFVLGEPVTVPDNCVLLFEGGSLDGGTLTLTDTYIIGYRGFKPNLVVTGTVANNKVQSEWFEIPADNCFNAFKYMFRVSAASKKPVNIKQGEYELHWDATDSDITISESVNFNNSIVNIYTGNNEEVYYTVTNNEVHDIPQEDWSGFRDIVNNQSVKSETSKKYKNCLVWFSTDVLEFTRLNDSKTYSYPQHEIFYIDGNGCIAKDVFFNKAGTFDEISTAHKWNGSYWPAQYIKCDNRITIENATINVTDEFEGNQTVEYRSMIFQEYFCSHLYFRNITFGKEHTEEDTNYTYRTLNTCYCYDVQLINIDTASWYDRHSVKGGKNYSTYNLGHRDTVNILWDNVRIGAQNWPRWGDTGCNYLRDWTIRNSALNRVDTHYRLNNLYMENCVLGLTGLCFTGWGKAVIENCTFETNSIIKSRSDYGSFFDGDIVLRDCTWNIRFTDPAAIVLTSLLNHDFATESAHFNYYVARNVVVENLNIHNYRSQDVYLMISDTTNSSLSNEISVKKRYYPTFRISNMQGAESCVRVNINPYYDDFFWNTREIYLNDSNLASTLSIPGHIGMKQQGGTITDYNNKAVRDTNVYINNCTKVSGSAAVGVTEAGSTRYVIPNKVNIYIKNSQVSDVRYYAYNTVIENSSVSLYQPSFFPTSKNVKIYNSSFTFNSFTGESTLKYNRGGYFSSWNTMVRGCFYLENRKQPLGVLAGRPVYNEYNVQEPGYRITLNSGKQAFWSGEAVTRGKWLDGTGQEISVIHGIYNLTGLIPTAMADIEPGTVFSTGLVCVNGYSLPSVITVTMGDSTLTPGTDYTYDPTSGAIEILGAGGTGGVTDILIITATGTAE